MGCDLEEVKTLIKHHWTGNNYEELINLNKIWTLALICILYCYYIPSRLPKGIPRLLSLLPIFYFFTLLPIHLTNIHFLLATTGSLLWITTFRLTLFAFDLGPLSHQLKVSHFIILACFPIDLKTQTNQTPPSGKLRALPNWVWRVLKLLLLLIVFHAYNYRHYLPHYLVLVLHALHVYLKLEFSMFLFGVVARALVGFDFEPQFKEPFLASSVQDFWSRRWNLLITNLLRPTIYEPVNRYSTRVLGPAWGLLPAILATFLVSGLMHEVIHFYLTRVDPTWEVTWYFVVQGVWVAIEIIIKKTMKGKWRMHRAASTILTIVFVFVTGDWLYAPQLMRNGVAEKLIVESSVVNRILMCM